MSNGAGGRGLVRPAVAHAAHFLEEHLELLFDGAESGVRIILADG
jgi:hypothetical protein